MFHLLEPLHHVVEKGERIPAFMDQVETRLFGDSPDGIPLAETISEDSAFRPLNIDVGQKLGPSASRDGLCDDLVEKHDCMVPS